MGCSTNIFALFLFWCFTSGLCMRYTVIVMTGYYQTSSRVEIRLVGDSGRTSAHDLRPWGGTFKRKNIFTIKDRDVGKLNTVEVYLHDGSSSRWWLNKIIVAGRGVYSFIYNNEVPTGKWITLNSKCPRGFVKGSRGTCVDIDECRKNPCKGPLVKCQNTIGSYRCECPRGYRVRFNERCEDINECFQQNLCDHKCVNTPGSYRCECRSGYQLIEGKCFDRDECQDGSHNCDLKSTYCDNVRGTFYCYCNPGYKRLNSTRCEAMYCSSFTADKKTTYTPSRCTKNNANQYKDICTRGCTYGYELEDPSYKIVTCTKHGYWRGTFNHPPNYCIGVKCPALPAIKNGGYRRNSCGVTGGRHGDAGCRQGCNVGYKAVGGTTYQCQANGTWIGEPVTCKKVYAAPKIDCPYEITKILPVGKSSTSIGSQWKPPKSNYNKFTVTPSGANSHYEFLVGTTVITWTVTNPDGKTASCTTRIKIEDKEPPKVVSCPDVFYPTYAKRPYFVKFKEPQFTDNVGVVRVRYMFASYRNGGVTLNQTSTVVLDAYDKAGNSARCRFTVYIGGSKCTLHPGNDGNQGTWYPMRVSSNSRVVLHLCPQGTLYFGGFSAALQYRCDEATGKWTPDKVDDCVDFSFTNKTSPCPVGYVKTLHRTMYYCMQCPLGTIYKKDVNGKETCHACSAGTFQNKRGSTTCNKCPVGTHSRKEDHKCRDLCPRGTFSQDSMRSFCSLCPKGQYQPKEGQTSCLNCAANKFTNTKLGSFSCQDVKPGSPQTKGVLVISSIVKPKAWNTDSKGNTTLECYINDNNYKPVSVQWKVDNNGIPDDFLGKLKFEEIRNAADKPVGARVIVTQATKHNTDVDYTCVAVNPNGETRKTVKIPDN